MDKERKEINAVHERDLDNLLQKLGVRENFEAGTFGCKFCKSKITRENLYSIIPESGMINFVCDDPECVIQFSEYSSRKNMNETG